MQFDNYHKQNSFVVGPQFDSAIFHQQQGSSFAPIQLNQKTSHNSQIADNSFFKSPTLGRHTEQFQKNPQVYQTGPDAKRNFKYNSHYNNNAQHYSDLNSHNYLRQMNEFIKRKDSMTQNNFSKDNQQQNVNNKYSPAQNTYKNSLRNYGIQQQRNFQYDQKSMPPGSLSKSKRNQKYKQQDNQSKNIKQYREYVLQEKSNYSTDNHQKSINQIKKNYKPYATVFKTDFQNGDIEKKKTHEPYFKYFEKFAEEKNQDTMYKFHLKNVSNNFNNFSKTTDQQNQNNRYYTPAASKQNSQTQGKALFSQITQCRTNNFSQSQTLEEKVIHKSPSSDLLEGKKNQKKKIINDQSRKNSPKDDTNQQNKISNLRVISQRSQTFADGEMNRQKQNINGCHILIQNLQKKFKEQKQTSQSIEIMQKKYQNQIYVRDEKIKTLQKIIQNNKQTLKSMQDTIKSLKKKTQETRGIHVQNQMKSRNLRTLIEKLQKQNSDLKDQIKRSQKSITIEHSLREMNDKEGTKIKDLQRALSGASKQKQLLISEITKIKQSYAVSQSNYTNEIQEHQKTHEELKRLQETISIINSKRNEKQQSLINQFTNQQFSLQQKYDKSIQKLRIQEEDFLRQKVILAEQIQNQKTMRESSWQESQKLRAKIQVLQNEIDSKFKLIKSYEEKLAQKQNVFQQYLKKQFSINQVYHQKQNQLQALKSKITKIEQKNENLFENLTSKTKLVQLITFQKSQLQGKVQKLQNQIKILSQEHRKCSPQIVKTHTDITQAKTFDSDSGKQLCQFKQILLLLDLYHQKYNEIINMFNLNEQNRKNSDPDSLVANILSQEVTEESEISKIQPSKGFISHYHYLLIDEIKKVLKDMKKLLGVLKECESQIQQKNQRLYDLDKNLKKQNNKINALIGEIHMKNLAIAEINNAQVQKQIFKLNERYEILSKIEANQ